ncbi:MAG: hypothetical protein CFK52_02750 [Chloracidobacterium sp. CP2_5A]|nr:MAG: hypothetical protein CFK52_02750 [Chloracidobacterium sp. CP2_5A]
MREAFEGIAGDDDLERGARRVGLKKASIGQARLSGELRFDDDSSMTTRAYGRAYDDEDWMCRKANIQLR